jgi:hypothetical protein
MFNKLIMKRILLIVFVTGVFSSCQNNTDESIRSDSTTNSITPPSTTDTANTIAPMMGDTSKTEADSLKK